MERRSGLGLRLGTGLLAPRRQDADSDKTSRRADERLAGGDFILA
jgi:hypothetical protein